MAEKGCGRVIQEDIPVLVPLLYGVIPRWEQFGCHLPMNYDSIQQIKRGAGSQKGVKDKLIEVLDWYRNKQGPKDWRDIIKALQDIRNHDLASRVPKKGPVPVHDESYITLMMDTYRLKEVAADWKSFGMQLGVPYSELNGMDAGRQTPRDSMEQLLVEWIQTKGKEANISAIIEACQKVGNYALAEELKKKPAILKIMNRTISTPSPTHSNTGSTDAEMEEKARHLLRVHQSKLKDVIVSAEVVSFVYVCFEKGLLTQSAKSTLVSATSGQTEETRAYSLLDKIRGSLGYNTQDTVDSFLCVLHMKGGRSGQSISQVIGSDFGYPLKQFSALINRANKGDQGGQGGQGDQPPVEASLSSQSDISVEEVSCDGTAEEVDHSTTTSSELDCKRLLDKSPCLEDILEVVDEESDSEIFRKALKAPIKGELRDAMEYWINKEPTDVTWRNLIKGLKEASQTTKARYLVNTYLIRSDVYAKYIKRPNFQSFDDLGI